MHIRRVVAVGLALTFLGAVAPTVAQRNDDNNRRQPQRSKQEQQDIETVTRLVDAVSAGQQPAPTDVPVTWQSNHFVKGQEGTHVLFTVRVDRSRLNSPAAAVYIGVLDKNRPPPAAAPADERAKPDGAKPDDRAPQARPAYAWENIYFVDLPEDGKVSRAMALPPGEYEAFVAVKDKTTDQRNPPPAKVGVGRHEMKVPDFSSGELAASTVILAGSVQQLPAPLTPEQQLENPYVFGPMRVVPSEDGRFSKASELNVIFWIYGTKEAASGKPDVTVEYNFHHRLPEGEKYFNKTAPAELNAQTLPPEFSLAAGHQLNGWQTVPLGSFPEGDFRLEIKIIDKPSGKTLTENVLFTVLPS